MNLLKAYEELSARIEKVSFNDLWDGFQKTKFAVYTDKEVCFNGEILPKTDEFLANTSICYNGEEIAIWQLIEPYDADVIASKIIHEMFHAFQKQYKKLVYPTEISATLNYRYSAENLSAKYRENTLLSEFVVEFDSSKFNEFCSLRKYRQRMFCNEIQYEMAIEQLEGSANYVELAALEQLSVSKYSEKLSNMCEKLNNENLLFPIRIISYDVGALLIKAIKDNNIQCTFPFDSDSFMTDILENVSEHTENVENESIKQVVHDYYENTRQMISAAIEENNKIDVADGRLTGYNVYNARYTDNHLLTAFFVMYEADKQQHILYGDFVVEITPELEIVNLYKTNLSL